MARWITQLFLTYPKTGAILNKIANIIPNKCFKKCTGILSIQINKLIFNM
jgi:ArsR family metal-binding transcriptional regulator